MTEAVQHNPPVTLVRMRGINKHFGPVQVLCDVDLDVYGGETHIIAGENGAGKSTLIRILGGVYSDYTGTIEISGQPARPRSPMHASSLGIAVIYQELSLVPTMSVAENIYLGRPITGAGGFVRLSEQRGQARKLLGRLGLEIDVDAPVGSLPIGAQQLIEIAKALSRDARVIIMDEPSSALSDPEARKLFGLVNQLKQRGCAIIYITHKMEEIQHLADRITVLRDGRLIGSAPRASFRPPN